MIDNQLQGHYYNPVLARFFQLEKRIFNVDYFTVFFNRILTNTDNRLKEIVELSKSKTILLSKLERSD